MGLWNAIRGEFVDIIEWTDDSHETMVCRFDRHDHEIKNGAKLVVRPGQVAIFVNEGQLQPGSVDTDKLELADVFQPGTYDLTTQNLPLLSTLRGWKFGFDSPFKAEVYFVNTTLFTDLKWGTRAPVMVQCAGYGMFDLRANGTYVMQIREPVKLLQAKVGTDGRFHVDEIADDLRDEIVMQVSDRLGELSLEPAQLTGQLKELSDELQKPLQQYFANYGLEITRFRITSLTMPDDVRREIMELSRLGASRLAGIHPGALQNISTLRASRALGDLANNPGAGSAGAGMGVGMGMLMSPQMGSALAGAMNAAPPLPILEYTVAINNEKHGPYPIARLQAMAAEGRFKPDMLVWTKGMNDWTKAGAVPELAGVFGSVHGDVPPPLPPAV